MDPSFYNLDRQSLSIVTLGLFVRSRAAVAVDDSSLVSVICREGVCLSPTFAGHWWPSLRMAIILFSSSRTPSVSGARLRDLSDLGLDNIVLLFARSVLFCSTSLCGDSAGQWTLSSAIVWAHGLLRSVNVISRSEVHGLLLSNGKIFGAAYAPLFWHVLWFPAGNTKSWQCACIFSVIKGSRVGEHT